MISLERNLVIEVLKVSVNIWGAADKKQAAAALHPRSPGRLLDDTSRTLDKFYEPFEFRIDWKKKNKEMKYQAK